MTARQKKALQALIASPTKAEAARAAGIGESTLRAYLSDPDFKREYESALSGLMADALATAKRGMNSAVDVLRRIAENEEESAQTRVTACKALIESGLKLDERINVQRRLDELEAAVAEFERR